MLVPKHQYQRDILIEAIVLHARERRGTWVMKRGLKAPGLLYLLGGVEIDQEGSRENVEAAVEITGRLRRGDVVVNHAEQHRYLGEMGEIKRGILKLAARTERKYGIPVPVIPMGIEYASPIRARLGEPLVATLPDLSQRLYEELGRLSGL